MLGACEPRKHETGLHPQCSLVPLLGGSICSQFPFVWRLSWRKCLQFCTKGRLTLQCRAHLLPYSRFSQPILQISIALCHCFTDTFHCSMSLLYRHFPLLLRFVSPSQDKYFASFQVSEPLDWLSCITAGRSSNPR